MAFLSSSTPHSTRANLWLNPDSCHTLLPHSRPSSSLFIAITSPLQWQGTRVLVSTGTYENHKHFLHLQSPLSTPSRHFFSYPNITTPLSLVLSYTLHTHFYSTFHLHPTLTSVPNRTTQLLASCP